MSIAASPLAAVERREPRRDGGVAVADEVRDLCTPRHGRNAAREERHVMAAGERGVGQMAAEKVVGVPPRTRTFTRTV